MAGVFLAHTNAAGSDDFTELSLDGDSCIFFLPDHPTSGNVSLSPVVDDQHSYLCLEVHHHFALLRTFENRPGRVLILTVDQIDIPLPLSTATHHKSVILRPDDYFLAPSGRWAVKWDESGSISDSMRPPQLQPVMEPNTMSGTLETQEEMIEEVVVNTIGIDGTGDADDTDKSSDATCSPTPSPTKADPKERTGPETPSSPKKSPGGTQSRENSPPEQIATVIETSWMQESHNSVEPVSEADTSEGLGKVKQVLTAEEMPATSGDPGDDHSMTDGSLLSNDKMSLPPSTSGSSASALETADTTKKSIQKVHRGSKRKLQEIDNIPPVSDTETPESEIWVDAVADDTITISQQRQQPYVLVDDKPLPKTPRGRNKARESSTSARESPASGLARSSLASEGRSVAERQKNTPSGVYDGPTPIIVFSGKTTVQDKKPTMLAIERLGGRSTLAINDANILCIPEGPIMKTGKLILAVASGLEIVTEKWLTDAHRLGRLPSVESYLPRDSAQERAWQCSLGEAIKRGKTGLTHLLNGITVHLTKHLREQLGNLEREMSQVAYALGADGVERRLPALKDKDTLTSANTLIIGTHGDRQADQIARLRQPLYNKDMLTMAALRGKLELKSQEFVIELLVKEEE